MRRGWKLKKTLVNKRQGLPIACTAGPLLPFGCTCTTQAKSAGTCAADSTLADPCNGNINGSAVLRAGAVGNILCSQLAASPGTAFVYNHDCRVVNFGLLPDLKKNGSPVRLQHNSRLRGWRGVHRHAQRLRLPRLCCAGAGGQLRPDLQLRGQGNLLTRYTFFLPAVVLTLSAAPSGAHRCT